MRATSERVRAWRDPLPSREELVERAKKHRKKLSWFRGPDVGKWAYKPHLYQFLFHTASDDADRVLRFRHLVAGRRGGKTLSAAEETAYYMRNPVEFHRDYKGEEENDRPLWVWQLTKDYKQGRPSMWTFFEVLGRHGLKKDRDYDFNKTEKVMQFANGSIFEFKTAVDPQSLRGAGLDILWMDEAAFVPNEESWEVVRPALADKRGMVVTTTTPWGKNWFYEEFWNERSLADPDSFRVEYWSIHNLPGFPAEEWESEKKRLHPMLFAREYKASFDAFDGVDLSGEWLSYYTYGEIAKEPLKKYIGIDPAISLSDKADYFALAVIGITANNEQAYLLETFMGRLPFPDQVELIRQKWVKHRPQMIGVEAQAYQSALAQQLLRLPGLPPVVPHNVGGRGAKSKNERILSMAPLFQTRRIKVHVSMTDFVDQWISFDSEKTNQKDDVLDAVELAIRTAGILTPNMSNALDIPENNPFKKKAGSMEELARRDINKPSSAYVYDDEAMYDDW